MGGGDGGREDIAQFIGYVLAVSFLLRCLRHCPDEAIQHDDTDLAQDVAEDMSPSESDEIEACFHPSDENDRLRIEQDEEMMDMAEEEEEAMRAYD